MKKSKAVAIATNFHTHQMGKAPESVTIKSMGHYDGRIVLESVTLDESGQEETFEIEVDEIRKTATLRKIIERCDMRDFEQSPVSISQLNIGDTFRLAEIPTVYRLSKKEVRDDRLKYGITRDDYDGIHWASDLMVYPCAKSWYRSFKVATAKGLRRITSRLSRPVK